MDICTVQNLSEKVSNIFTSWRQDNSDLSTSHYLMNSMLKDIQIIFLESRFRHYDTIDQQNIFYIHGSRSFDLHVKHLKLVYQDFDLFSCNATTYDFRAKWGSFYDVMLLSITADESAFNLPFHQPLLNE